MYERLVTTQFSVPPFVGLFKHLGLTPKQDGQEWESPQHCMKVHVQI